ncbi:MAG: toll/interleukin-1 receptor domain-containing protein [Acidobacteriia bacterium]|nr:toll/interleukin-1 receptor domain-containing protein [Terriglobia bacterium]
MQENSSQKAPESQPRVFVCYAHRDERWAKWISNYLGVRGFDVWRDVEALPAGASWTNAIDQALSESNLVVAVMSPAFFESEWAQTETAAVAAKKMPIIPVMIEPCKVRGFLSYLNWADLTEDREKAECSM